MSCQHIPEAIVADNKVEHDHKSKNYNTGTTVQSKFEDYEEVDDAGSSGDTPVMTSPAPKRTMRVAMARKILS